MTNIFHDFQKDQYSKIEHSTFSNCACYAGGDWNICMWENKNNDLAIQDKKISAQAST